MHLNNLQRIMQNRVCKTNGKIKYKYILLTINLSSYEGTSHFGVYVEWQKRDGKKKKVKEKRENDIWWVIYNWKYKEH